MIYKPKYNQIVDGKYIGYHEDKSTLPIKKGNIVLIKKGTKFHSTRDGQYHTAGKTYKIKVFDLYKGAQWMENHEEGEVVHNPEVVWVGSGGYWHRADINDVEKVE
jgi:ribosomal protein L27